jgi:hypothetical protein
MMYSEVGKPSQGMNAGTYRSPLAYSLLQLSEFIAPEGIPYLRQAGPNTRQTSSGLPRPIRGVAQNSFSQYRYSNFWPSASSFRLEVA